MRTCRWCGSTATRTRCRATSVVVARPVTGQSWLTGPHTSKQLTWSFVHRWRTMSSTIVYQVSRYRTRRGTYSSRLLAVSDAWSDPLRSSGRWQRHRDRCAVRLERALPPLSEAEGRAGAAERLPHDDSGRAGEAARVGRHPVGEPAI